MRVLVGSTAIKYHYPEFRDPKDTDFFVDVLSTEKTLNGLRLEQFYSPAIMHWYDMEYPDSIEWQAGSRIATPDELYTIKVSHAFWELRNGSWAKHMWDTNFLQEKGAVLIPDFYTLLYAVWEERYGVKKANLNKTPEEFFTATVDRKYDHDSIHASIAYGEIPLFNAILRDGADVAVSRDKFQGLTEEDKIHLVMEECYATALERLLIPSDYKYNQHQAYHWALKKTITSFSKGWFPLWIVQNFAKVRKPDVDYVKKHLENKDRLVLL